jgi:hypothetical protein
MFRVTLFAWRDSRISTEILMRTAGLGVEEGEICAGEPVLSLVQSRNAKHYTVILNNIDWPTITQVPDSS